MHAADLALIGWRFSKTFLQKIFRENGGFHPK